MPTQRGRKYDPSKLENGLYKSKKANIMAFRLWTGEKVYFDERKKVALTYAVEKLKSQKEKKTNFAPLILQILASLGGIAQIESLASMFMMYAGHRATETDFLNGIRELSRLSVVNTARVAQGPQKKLKEFPVKGLKFIYITPFGALVEKNIYDNNIYGETVIEDTSRGVLSARKVKRNLIAVQIVCRLVSLSMLSHFEYGKKVKRESPGSGGRKGRTMSFSPHFTLNLKGSEILLRCIRKSPQWEKKELDNLLRLSRMFRSNPPTVFMVTEDYLMSTDLFKRLCENGRTNVNLIFTDDITFLNSRGKNFFYTIEYDGEEFIKKMI